MTNVSQGTSSAVPQDVIDEAENNGAYFDELTGEYKFPTREDFLSCVTQLHAQREQVGEWVMVPREPTEEMLGAFGIEYIEWHGPKECYKAMLSAATAPPLCTEEQAAELAESVLGIHCHGYSSSELAAIINAWAKR